MAEVYWRNPNDSNTHRFRASIRKIHLNSTDWTQQNGFILFPFRSDQGYFFQLAQERATDLPFPNPPATKYNTTKDQYISQVNAALNSFESNKLDKVVLARQWSAPGNAVNPESLFSILSHQYPTAFVYTIVWKDVVLFGASPELLMEHQGSSLKSMALAGTRPNNSSKPFTPKEEEEQAFVQRFIEKIANRLDFELTFKSERYEREAGHLKHLCNDYQWKSKWNSQVVSFLKELHPTPAVAGTPREQAIQFLKEHEQFDRGFYAGFLGEWGPNSQKLYVNLRCGLQHNAVNYLYAGAGISANSNPESEWIETTEKLKTLETILQQKP